MWMRIIKFTEYKTNNYRPLFSVLCTGSSTCDFMVFTLWLKQILDYSANNRIQKYLNAIWNICFKVHKYVLHVRNCLIVHKEFYSNECCNNLIISLLHMPYA